MKNAGYAENEIEEAEYWDKTDTADIIAQETEWFTFE